MGYRVEIEFIEVIKKHSKANKDPVLPIRT